ncbi:hypothetical protein, partial [Ruminococcus callidus]|uniref:hypothetical protein n=1 Tax=Ruminococcus callidus TaxID=40519 RepID=UPI0039933651
SLCGIALGNPFQKYSSLKEKRPCTEPVLWFYTGLFLHLRQYKFHNSQNILKKLFLSFSFFAV